MKNFLVIIFVFVIGVLCGIFLMDVLPKQQDTSEHPILGDKREDFEKIYGDGKTIKYTVDVNDENKVYNINFSSFPAEITSIGEAMVFLDKFLPNDAKLLSFNGGQECPGIYDRCINERYNLIYESETFKKLEGTRDTFDVSLDFKIQEDNENKINLFYMKIE